MVARSTHFSDRLHRCSTRFALALPALPATLGPKEYRTRMARTKFNGNASEKSSANLGFKADFGFEHADTTAIKK